MTTVQLIFFSMAYVSVKGLITIPSRIRYALGKYIYVTGRKTEVQTDGITDGQTANLYLST